MAKKANTPPPKDPNDDYNNMYGTKTLSGDDIAKPTYTEITEVGREIYDRPDGRSEAKATLKFKDFTKPLVCNKTNATQLAMAYGKDLTKWVGKRVLVKAEMTSYQGKPIRGVRLYPPEDLNDSLPV